MIVAFMAAFILIYLVYSGLSYKKNDTNDKKNTLKSENKKNDTNDKNENINTRIDRAMMNYTRDVSKYNIGAKSYEYDFINNEQPLNGLSPNFSQNYPTTLKKSNKMFVVPDLSIKYDNLLNTKNNSLKNYIYNMK